MNKIIECVPNFSEGRNPLIIKEITDAIESVNQVYLLNVDTGKATNRTVVTFIGEPEYVVEAAFRGIKKASELIDMTQHSGEHPRFGATDVCPLVPVANISIDEVVIYARQLAKRVGDELKIPVYCYEYAAFNELRKSLANCRAGEYESLEVKITDNNWKPDFGSTDWNSIVAKSGAVAIGARNFLIAYNVNLNTNSIKLANEIASEVRESGRIVMAKNGLTHDAGKNMTEIQIRIKGTLKGVRAIGWYIQEYGISQVSMNLTDISVTPLHIAFDEVKEKALGRGIDVTGSELIGLIPLKSMIDAGNYFLRKQNQNTRKSDDEIIAFAIKSLGLDELYPFEPRKRILEYLINDFIGTK